MSSYEREYSGLKLVSETDHESEGKSTLTFQGNVIFELNASGPCEYYEQQEKAKKVYEALYALMD